MDTPILMKTFDEGNHFTGMLKIDELVCITFAFLMTGSGFLFQTIAV